MQEYSRSLRLNRLPTPETHLRAQQLSIPTQCASQVPAPLCILEAFVLRSKQTRLRGIQNAILHISAKSNWPVSRLSEGSILSDD